MIVVNNKPLMINGKFLKPKSTVRKDVTVLTSNNGYVTPSKLSGYENEIITVSNTPDQYYELTNYNITGSTMTGDDFRIGAEDIFIQGVFSPITYNITYTNDGHGTLTGGLTTATGGQSTTLTATPDYGYIFNTYNVTGGTISNNVLTITSNCTANANFELNPEIGDNTLRLLYTEGVTPSANRGTFTQISQNPNIWDFKFANLGTHSLYRQEELLSVLKGNIKSNTDSYFMGYCDKLSSVNNLNFSGLTSMRGMFAHCPNLISVEILNTNSVSNFDECFLGCSSMSSGPVLDTSNATTTKIMFSQCSSMTSVPLYNMANVHNTRNMFFNCKELKTVPLFDLSNVTDAYSMFESCISLTSVPAFNLSSLSSIDYLLNKCSALKYIPDFTVNRITAAQGSFYWCYNVSGGILNIYNKIKNASLHDDTFDRCGISSTQGSAELAQIPASWK